MLPFHYIGFNPYGSIALKLTCSFILLAVSLFVFYKILILPKLRIKKEASYITGTVIPFFRQIETEFHGKYPVLMCDIDPNFPDLMPEDNNKTCIFFAKTIWKSLVSLILTCIYAFLLMRLSILLPVFGAMIYLTASSLV